MNTKTDPTQNSELAEDFRILQLRLGQHLRDPEKFSPPKKLEDRRLQIYRDLLFNNIKNFLSEGFPVLCSLYSPEAWQALSRSFYRQHQSHSPWFSHIGAEFVEYLVREHQPSPEDPPFSGELAHYEYAETALFTAPDSDLKLDQTLDPIENLPILTPLAWVYSYRWPVHTISAESIPSTPPEARTHILLYRNQADQVKFMILSPAVRQLIDAIKKQEDASPRMSGQAIVDDLIAQHAAYAPFRDHALDEIRNFHKKGVIAGARPL